MWMSIKSDIRKGISYGKRNGLRETFYQARERFLQKMHQTEYEKPVPEIPKPDFVPGAVISVIVPVYETPEEYLRVMIESVLAQSYDALELCIADGSASDEVERIVSEYMDLDNRIRYEHLKDNGGISENTNAAIRMATGEYLAFLDHDDFLEPDALYQVYRRIDGIADLFYTDEDKTDETGTIFHTPHYKEKFNLDLFLSNNYICHLFVVKSEIARMVGGFRRKYDGAQDYDFILRCVEKSSAERIVHIPKVLYHWRAHEASTAENPDSKSYAYESGVHVLEDYLSRRGLEGTVLTTSHLGFYRIEYKNTNHENYVMIVDDKIRPISEQEERYLGAYFCRPEVGAVGGRMIGRNGKVLSDGYHKLPDDSIQAVNAGRNRHDSGYMHRLCLQRDVEAVSRHAIAIRSEFAKFAGEMKSYQLCEKIRREGYLVVLDPKVQFRMK